MAAFFSGVSSQRIQDFLLPGPDSPNKRELRCSAKHLDHFAELRPIPLW
jgi:hypothetical protein